MLEKMLNYDLHATEMMTAYDQMWAVFAGGRPTEAFNVNGTQVNQLPLAILRGLSNGNERLHADCIKYRPSIVAKWGL